jgi:hypothetical protein
MFRVVPILKTDTEADIILKEFNFLEKNTDAGMS